LVEGTIAVFIVLRPNLIDQMRNDLLVFSTVNELFEKFGGVNSLFIWLADKGSKNKLWHIFDFYVLQIEMLSVFVLGNNDGFSIFHELIVRSGVVLIRLLFVQQFTS
jgi:hypothetical protein